MLHSPYPPPSPPQRRTFSSARKATKKRAPLSVARTLRVAKSVAADRARVPYVEMGRTSWIPFMYAGSPVQGGGASLIVCFASLSYKHNSKETGALLSMLAEMFVEDLSARATFHRDRANRLTIRATDVAAGARQVRDVVAKSGLLLRCRRCHQTHIEPRILFDRPHPDQTNAFDFLIDLLPWPTVSVAPDACYTLNGRRHLFREQPFLQLHRTIAQEEEEVRGVCPPSPTLLEEIH